MRKGFRAYQASFGEGALDVRIPTLLSPEKFPDLPVAGSRVLLGAEKFLDVNCGVVFYFGTLA